jgi:hypothetical protein
LTELGRLNRLPQANLAAPQALPKRFTDLRQARSVTYGQKFTLTLRIAFNRRNQRGREPAMKIMPTALLSLAICLPAFSLPPPLFTDRDLVGEWSKNAACAPAENWVLQGDAIVLVGKTHKGMWAHDANSQTLTFILRNTNAAAEELRVSAFEKYPISEPLFVGEGSNRRLTKFVTFQSHIPRDPAGAPNARAPLRFEFTRCG